ncbi:MAG: type II secretion system protein [Ruminococcus sp.]|uniref:type IV pilin protein n=1 Tax=Ruminococcus sp. TaxID=41978 RepID=UPI0025FDDE8E|nr:type II secretion system protein [Ruminococcus sp.]MBR5682460.1 type II secretion system protein [Ruminococcus sp.]
MKNAKKGFTLIELIVVIAIIGVLAAILVPSMLGYVRKSKISSANSAASSIQKAINTALTEMDEETENGADITQIAREKGDPAVASGDGFTDDGTCWKKIQHYMDKAKGCAFLAECDGGAAVAVAVALDSKYTGTYPSGVVTVDNYKDYCAPAGVADLDDALAEAKTKVPATDEG